MKTRPAVVLPGQAGEALIIDSDPAFLLDAAGGAVIAEREAGR